MIRDSSIAEIRTLDDRLNNYEIYRPAAQLQMARKEACSANYISTNIITFDSLWGGRFAKDALDAIRNDNNAIKKIRDYSEKFFGHDFIDYLLDNITKGRKELKHLKGIDSFLVLDQGIFDGKSDFDFKDPLLVVLMYNFFRREPLVWIPGRYKEVDANEDILFVKYVYEREQELFKEKVLGISDDPSKKKYTGYVSFGLKA